MDYHKNAPWTAVSREGLARLVIHDGLPPGSASAPRRQPNGCGIISNWESPAWPTEVRGRTTARAGQVP